MGNVVEADLVRMAQPLMLVHHLWKQTMDPYLFSRILICALNDAARGSHTMWPWWSREAATLSA